MIDKFRALLSHLNAEDNDMAMEFEDELTKLIIEHEKYEEDSQFLQCLQNAGVDNWDGYEIAQEEMWPEDEDA